MGRRPRSRPASPILVLLTMYGGNDGLNTLVPYADPAYHDSRPELAYKPEEVLHLDDTLGLNPGLKGLSDLWSQQKLAIVRGVGYPKPDHSHFRSMDIWQTASPESPVVERLGRALARHRRRRPAPRPQHRRGAAAAGRRCQGDRGRAVGGRRRWEDVGVGDDRGRAQGVRDGRPSRRTGGAARSSRRTPRSSAASRRSGRSRPRRATRTPATRPGTARGPGSRRSSTSWPGASRPTCPPGSTPCRRRASTRTPTRRWPRPLS